MRRRSWPCPSPWRRWARRAAALQRASWNKWWWWTRRSSKQPTTPAQPAPLEQTCRAGDLGRIPIPSRPRIPTGRIPIPSRPRQRSRRGGAGPVAPVTSLPLCSGRSLASLHNGLLLPRPLPEAAFGRRRPLLRARVPRRRLVQRGDAAARAGGEGAAVSIRGRRCHGRRRYRSRSRRCRSGAGRSKAGAVPVLPEELGLGRRRGGGGLVTSGKWSALPLCFDLDRDGLLVHILALGGFLPASSRPPPPASVAAAAHAPAPSPPAPLLLLLRAFSGAASPSLSFAAAAAAALRPRPACARPRCLPRQPHWEPPPRRTQRTPRSRQAPCHPWHPPKPQAPRGRAGPRRSEASYPPAPQAPGQRPSQAQAREHHSWPPHLRRERCQESRAAERGYP